MLKVTLLTIYWYVRLKALNVLNVHGPRFNASHDKAFSFDVNNFVLITNNGMSQNSARLDTNQFSNEFRQAKVKSLAGNKYTRLYLVPRPGRSTWWRRTNE